MREHRFELRCLEEIFDLSERLAGFFPYPEKTQLGIYELLLNALEHGNLEIGRDLKTKLVREGTWEAEIRRRMACSPYAERTVGIVVTESAEACTIMITDEGTGFDWKDYIGSLAPRFNHSPHGRGLWIALHAEFDEVRFNDIGNQVTCVSKR